MFYYAPAPARWVNNVFDNPFGTVRVRAQFPPGTLLILQRVFPVVAEIFIVRRAVFVLTRGKLSTTFRIDRARPPEDLPAAR